MFQLFFTEHNVCSHATRSSNTGPIRIPSAMPWYYGWIFVSDDVWEDWNQPEPNRQWCSDYDSYDDWWDPDDWPEDKPEVVQQTRWKLVKSRSRYVFLRKTLRKRRIPVQSGIRFANTSCWQPHGSGCTVQDDGEIFPGRS